MELLKLLSANEIVAQIINFLILLILLRIFFWKRILQLLDDRKARIASEFKNIEDAKKEVEKLKSDFGVKITSIEQIAKARIEEAVEQGSKAAEKIRHDAYVESQKIIESAKAEVKHEVAKAKDELKDKIVDLVIEATENLISERLTEKDDKKIVEDFLGQIDKM